MSKLNAKEVKPEDVINTSEVAIVRDDANGHSIALRVNGKGYLVSVKDIIQVILSDEEN